MEPDIKIFNPLFEVDQEDFRAFKERLYKEKINVYQSPIDSPNYFICFYSKKNNLPLCGLSMSLGEDKYHYFIFDYPDNDEWGDPKPKQRIEITDPELANQIVTALLGGENLDARDIQ